MLMVLTFIVDCFQCTLGAISDGMHYGWTAPIIPILHSSESPVAITEEDEIWLETIYMVGGLCGLPVTIYLVDKFGRKTSILLSSTASMLSWALIASASAILQVHVARFLAGMSGNIVFVAGPIFVAEIAQQNVRGLLTGLIFILLLIGTLIVYCVGPFVEVYATSLVGASFWLLQICTFTFVPESPYYLLIEGKEEKALKSLQFFRAGADVTTEFREIKEAIERQKSEKGRPQDLILIPSNRKAVIIMLFLTLAQTWSGLPVILMNLHIILESAGEVYIESEYSAIIFGCFMLIAAIFSDAIVDKAGRKVLLASSGFLTAASLFVLATYFAAKDAGVDVSSISWVPVVTIMIYAVVFKYGIGLVPVIMISEIFPASVKAMGLTISDAIYVICGTTALYFYLEIVKICGIHIPLYVFSVVCIIVSVFSMLFIPETRGKTLEEIQLILKGMPQKK